MSYVTAAVNVLHVCGSGWWARGLWDCLRIQLTLLLACLSGAIASLFMVACRQASCLISSLNGVSLWLQE